MRAPPNGRFFHDNLLHFLPIRSPATYHRGPSVSHRIIAGRFCLSTCLLSPQSSCFDFVRTTKWCKPWQVHIIRGFDFRADGLIRSFRDRRSSSETFTAESGPSEPQFRGLGSRTGSSNAPARAQFACRNKVSVFGSKDDQSGRKSLTKNHH